MDFSRKFIIPSFAVFINTILLQDFMNCLIYLYNFRMCALLLCFGTWNCNIQGKLAAMLISFPSDTILFKLYLTFYFILFRKTNGSSVAAIGGSTGAVETCLII